ncbi:hypothetical protein NLU13_2355 [Sarocladium strictum]|uniref:DNA/RNA-binding domain-containing protein n=1 Tax=Sarocladium strictum TaxID=5046 RepID=A0AA39GTI7_SARSR|nr:hypothetical protein NLU13_2355 [Sarocladium strictum]
MSHIEQGFIKHQRRAAAADQKSADRRDRPRRQPSCPVCKAEAPSDLEGFRRHVLDNRSRHRSLGGEADIADAFDKMSLSRQHAAHAEQPQEGVRPRNKRASDSLSREDASDSDPPGTDPPESTQPDSKKRASPTTSVRQQRGSPRSTLADRSRARLTPASARQPRSSRNKAAGRMLWDPSQEQPKNHGLKAHSDLQRDPRHDPRQPKPELNTPYADPESMIREPLTRPISQEQIVQEVKTIYSGLVMVENKCIEVNNLQTENGEEKSDLSKEQWQALITLHRTLLHEHHDFFLASQHPSANSALKRLASKYSMPARMWRHGIHSFLELLRHNLPESRDYMLTFIYLAYSIMALLYETVPAFDETWIECLGDLSRYRMAIEEEDIRDREIWTGVSRNWYSKASEKSPTTGRLYHHLAILARPDALQQLFYYSKSLCVVIPFPSARESIVTLFEPLLDPENTLNNSVDAAFVRVQGMLFTGKATKDELSAWRSDFLARFDSHIGRTRRPCSLLGFGDEKNILMRAITQRSDDGYGVATEENSTEVLRRETFEAALSFAVEAWSIVIQRWGDVNTLACHHTMLVFLLHLSRFPAAMAHVEKKLPWKLISIMLNYLLDTTQYRPKLEDSDGENTFAAPKNDSHRPLPDDYALRGLIYAEDYLPKGMFPVDFDEDEKYIEMSSMAEDRVKRILWIGCKIARSRTWLVWDAGNNEFGTTLEYDVAVEEVPVPAAVPGRRSPSEVVGEQV